MKSLDQRFFLEPNLYLSLYFIEHDLSTTLSTFFMSQFDYTFFPSNSFAFFFLLTGSIFYYFFLYSIKDDLKILDSLINSRLSARKQKLINFFYIQTFCNIILQPMLIFPLTIFYNYDGQVVINRAESNVHILKSDIISIRFHCIKINLINPISRWTFFLMFSFLETRYESEFDIRKLQNYLHFSNSFKFYARVDFLFFFFHRLWIRSRLDFTEKVGKGVSGDIFRKLEPHVLRRSSGVCLRRLLDFGA